MRYQEFPPPSGLAGLVDCLWLSDAPAAPAGPALLPVAHRVLPDNCTDILWQDSGDAFFVGMMSTWFDVPAARRVRTVAVRFRPGAASLFVGPVPLAGLVDQRAGLDQLWGRSAADRLGDELWSVARSDAERLALLTEAIYARLALAPAGARAASAADRLGDELWSVARSDAERLALLTEALYARLALAPAGARAASALASRVVASAPAGQALALHAVAQLEASGGGLRVESLAAALGVSRQYLANQFRDHVGLSPKLFARICRFRAARTAALAAEPGRHGHDWATLALDSGYFDQSHLIRDFQDFTGASPDVHLGNR